jgi:hypothetical protein
MDLQLPQNQIPRLYCSDEREAYQDLWQQDIFLVSRRLFYLWFEVEEVERCFGF